MMGPPIGTDVLRGQPAPMASQSGELTCMHTQEGQLPAQLILSSHLPHETGPSTSPLTHRETEAQRGEITFLRAQANIGQSWK